MAQVQIIQPYQPQSDALEKVAAYCRVSTDSSDQLNSYRTQIGYYTNFIAQHPSWELADIYADEGITGTSLEKRDEFKRMLQDCRAGKIQRILVKSVSRFARNTLELIETTRELKDLGVVVVFEEQGIDTAQMLGGDAADPPGHGRSGGKHIHLQKYAVELSEADGTWKIRYHESALRICYYRWKTHTKSRGSCCCTDNLSPLFGGQGPTTNCLSAQSNRNHSTRIAQVGPHHY